MKSPNELKGWRKYLGIPYKHLGRDYSGLDCYGLLMLYAKEFLGVELDDWWYEENWANKGQNYFSENYQPVAFKVDVPKKHDVILICSDLSVRVPNHVGILVEEPDIFIQCLKNGVVKSTMNNRLIRTMVEGYYRIKRNG